MHRQIENSALNVIDADPVLSRRLTALSLWTSLQAFGRDAIAGRISIAFDCCRMVYEIVSKCQGLRVLVSFKLIACNLRMLKLFTGLIFFFNRAKPRVVVQTCRFQT